MSSAPSHTGAEATLGTVRVEPDGPLVADRSAARLLGHEEETGDWMTEDPDLVPLVAALQEGAEVLRAGADSWDAQVTLPDEVILEVLMHRDPLGESQRLYALVRDVTRQQQQTEQAHRAQRLEALSHLAGELAHEFNNASTAILGLTDLLLLDARDTPSRVLLGQVQAAARRGQSLTDQLLTFGRRHARRESSCDPTRVFQGVIDLVRQSFPHNIEIGVDLQAGPCLLEADPEQLGQAFLNLALNARDALGETPGVIVFSSTRVEMDDQQRQHFPEAAAGTYLLFEIGDTGHGIPKETQARLFQPFFTTRAGSRTGLGLPTAYGIVTSYGGHMTFVSEPGVGTRFLVLLPYAPSEAAGVPAQAPPPSQAEPSPSPTHDELVLFVDDEESIRLFAGAALRRRGYRALTARHGQEAVDLLRAHRGEIRMVFLDLTMPIMGGHEAFERMREIQPDLPIVVISGYGVDSRVTHLMDQGAVAFMAKPFNVQELLTMVETALRSASSGPGQDRHPASAGPS